MATTYTTNYNLGKQENHADKFDMDVITDNADKIDAALTGLQSGIDGKQAALTPEQLAAVNSGVTSTDVEQIGLNKNNILSIYDTGYAQKNVMRIVLDEVKTLLPSQSFVGNTTTFGNLSVTFNEDNSITLNGSHTAAVAINFKDLSHINMPTNAVGAASANITLSNDIFFGLWGDSGVSNLVLNDGVDIPSDYASKYSRGFVIRVSANTVCNNIRIYPMVCDKALYQASSEVVPYALPNTVITPVLVECVDNGAKNLINTTITNLKANNEAGTWNGNKYTVNGVEWTINNDGSVKVKSLNSTHSESILWYYNNKSSMPQNIKVGDRIHASSKTNTNNVGISVWNSINGTSWNSQIMTDNNNEINVPQDTVGLGIRLLVMANQSVDTTLYPMICSADYWAASPAYQPYALSNSDLTAKTAVNENNISSLTAKSQKTISSSGNTSKLRLTLDTTAMSNANRGSLILSIPFQTSSYDNALLLIAIGNDRFLGVQRIDNSTNSMVTSWALSENNTILDITLRAQPWSAPVAFPMAQVVPPITYSWES